MAACVARMMALRSRPLMMISITERTFSGNSEFAAGSLVEQRAELLVSARNREAILAACLRSAAGDAAGERHDDAGTVADGRHAALRRQPVQHPRSSPMNHRLPPISPSA